MRLVITAMFFAFAALVSAPALMAEDNVIVIDGKQPAKRQAQKPDSRTKVINLKGSPAQSAEKPHPDDICQKLGNQYYCKNRGRTALDAATGAPLGKITGLAWRERGQSIGAYLRVIEDAADTGPAIARNISARHEGFYYIIQDASGRVFMAETGRVAVEG